MITMLNEEGLTFKEIEEKIFRMVCECLMSSAFNSILSIILCFIGIHALL